MVRGAFILFEGVDRSGKTTQASRLVQHLNATGRPSVSLKCPDRTTATGTLLNSYLRREVELNDVSVHLLFSANRWEMYASLLKYLQDGVNVVMDRYVYSGVAFSACKRGMSLEWCMNADRGLLRPDVVLYLDVPDTRSRPGWGEERYETPEFQARVRDTFARLIRIENVNWYVVDASQTVDDVAVRVRDVVDALVLGDISYI